MHYAKKNVSEVGAVTYDTPVAMPGAVSISLEAQGELTPFYADGITYYNSSSNAGYEGDLEVALITDEFRKMILGEELDSKNVLFERADIETAEFALAFEVDGDQGPTKFWFYNCSATRPTLESETIEDKKEPSPEKITISCSASSDGKVRAKTTADTDEAVIADWYKQVYITAE